MTESRYMIYSIYYEKIKCLVCISKAHKPESFVEVSTKKQSRDCVMIPSFCTLYEIRNCDVIQNYKTLKRHFRKMNFLGKWLVTKPLKVYELREETIFPIKLHVDFHLLYFL